MGRPLDRLGPLAGGQYADRPTIRRAAAFSLTDLNAAPAQQPATLVRNFADMWSTLAQRSGGTSPVRLLTGLRVGQDKPVEPLPRWGEPV